jgi:hypothetical protein
MYTRTFEAQPALQCPAAQAQPDPPPQQPPAASGANLEWYYKTVYAPPRQGGAHRRAVRGAAGPPSARRPFDVPSTTPQNPVSYFALMCEGCECLNVHTAPLGAPQPRVRPLSSVGCFVGWRREMPAAAWSRDRAELELTGEPGPKGPGAVAPREGQASRGQSGGGRGSKRGGSTRNTNAGAAHGAARGRRVKGDSNSGEGTLRSTS